MTKNAKVATRQTLQPEKRKFTAEISSGGIQKLINSTLTDPQRRNRFVSAIVSTVGQSEALQKCTTASIVSAALVGEALNLHPNPTLGQYYLVPFNRRRQIAGEWVTESIATFILGWRGFLQLAQRSGQYKKINVLPIKAGELISYNPLEEEIDVALIADDTQREEAETIGYYAMFEYHNGFRKTLFWTREKMLAHAARYSKAFDVSALEKLEAGKIPEKDMWKYSSPWYTDFDAMGCKTMLRQLLGKWGIMSLEMVKAIEAEAEIEAGDDMITVGGMPEPESQEMIAEAETVEEDEEQEPFALVEDEPL